MVLGMPFFFNKKKLLLLVLLLIKSQDYPLLVSSVAKRMLLMREVWGLIGQIGAGVASGSPLLQRFFGAV